MLPCESADKKATQELTNVYTTLRLSQPLPPTQSHCSCNRSFGRGSALFYNLGSDTDLKF